MEAFWGFGQIMRQHVIPSVVGEYGMDFKDFITLISISEGAHYPKFICERLMTNPSDVSRILETLSKSGFVKRELDEHDSRRVRVTLTDHGQSVLRLARERIEALLTFAEGTLPDEELEQFSSTLMHLQSAIAGRVKELGLSPPAGDHRGWYGNWGKPPSDSS
jgi:DNA-binding MarR family transcriptional regulator